MGVGEGAAPAEPTLNRHGEGELGRPPNIGLSMQTSDLQTSYQCCQQVARHAASNFYWCFRLLPQEKREAMHALYAFSRRADDLVDNSRAIAERRLALKQWRSQLDDALAGQFSELLLPAMADTVHQVLHPRTVPV